ncbi:MAG: acyltransferase family protein [Pseudomonadota bacterium]
MLSKFFSLPSARVLPVAQAGYRPEIDGLRAIAVLMVILFHSGLDAASGGFTGVDVFFVISGYLIARIILTELDEGRFSFLRFYERRARRILPALILVLIASTIAALAIMPPDELAAYGKSVLATLFAVSNIFFWLDTGYFNADNELKPLLHTWSLAVEEQFYLVFPLCLFLAFGYIKRWTLILLVLGFFAGLAISEYAAQTASNAAYYLLPARFFELLVGVIIAWVERPSFLVAGGRAVPDWLAGPSPASRLLRETLSIVGLAMVLASSFVLETSPFPGLYALLPVGGAALIVAAARQGTFVAMILGWRPILALGLLSYSAYLWHQPLFAFVRLSALEPVEPVVLLALTPLIFLASWASWHWVEVPWRRHKPSAAPSGQRRMPRVVVGTASVASVALVAALALGTGGLPQRFDSTYVSLLASAKHSETIAADPECVVGGRRTSQEIAKACVHGGATPVAAVLGDSHGSVFAHALDDIIGPGGVKHLAFAACAPSLLVTSTQPGCTTWYRNAFEAVLSDHRIELVLLVNRHGQHLLGNNAWANYDPEAFMPTIEEGRTRGEKLAAYWASYEESIRLLREAGKQVLVLYPTPEMTAPMARLALFGPVEDNGRVIAMTRSSYDERAGEMMAALNAFVRPEERLDPRDFFCDARHCFASKGWEPLYFDDDHITTLAARELLRTKLNR